MKKDVLDGMAMSGMFERSDHYVVLAKINIKGRLVYGRKNGKSKVLASERINRKEVRKEYERKVCEKLREARRTVEDGASVNEVKVP